MQDMANEICKYIIVIGLVVYSLYATYKEFKPDGEKMKYKAPPLPFLGNKKGQLKNIDEVLTNMQYAGLINEKTIFYDVFGGSGLISHHIKQRFKNNRVIWNDYDDYQSRLDKNNKQLLKKDKII